MGSAVTITPDAAPVTITPDSNPPPDKSWLDSSLDAAKEIWNKVNPVQGVKGAAQLAAHPIDTYMADASQRQVLLDKAETEFKKGNYGQGMYHALYGIIPFMGTQLNEAKENFDQGNYAKGIGQSVGMGLNLSTPALVKGAGTLVKAAIPAEAAESAATHLYQSALKPSTTLPMAKTASIIKTGLENEITVDPAGFSKLGDLMDDLNTKIAGEVAKNPTAPINKYSVASRLGGAAQKFANQVNPEADSNAVANSGNEFLENQPTNIPASKAQALKQGTYQQLSSKAYGELGTATVEAQKALARGLKEEIAKQFPEIDQLNQQDARLINLSDVLEKAVKRIGNHQMMGIGTPIAGAAGSAITGSPIAGGAIGLMKSIIDDPFVKSKLAIALNKAANGQLPISAAQAKVAAYSSALGNAATGTNPNEPTAE